MSERLGQPSQNAWDQICSPGKQQVQRCAAHLHCSHAVSQLPLPPRRGRSPTAAAPQCPQARNAQQRLQLLGKSILLTPKPHHIPSEMSHQQPGGSLLSQQQKALWQQQNSAASTHAAAPTSPDTTCARLQPGLRHQQPLSNEVCRVVG